MLSMIYILEKCKTGTRKWITCFVPCYPDKRSGTEAALRFKKESIGWNYHVVPYEKRSSQKIVP